MIAVMGASGNVGAKVADRLLSSRRKVRVLEHSRPLDALRDRGAAVVGGDAADAGALRELFDGADAAFVVLPDVVADPRFVATRSALAKSIAAALRSSGVGHVVAVSAAAAGSRDCVGPPAGLREFEALLRKLTGTSVLVLRAASYMDYLLANLPLIEAEGVNGGAIPGDVAFPMVATADVAAEAAARLSRRDFEGFSTRLLLGPADVTMRQATSAIGARIGKADLPYVDFPPDGVKGALLGAGMSDEAASAIVDMQVSIGDGRFYAGVVRTPESATPTTLDAFLDGALAR